MPATSSVNTPGLLQVTGPNGDPLPVTLDGGSVTIDQVTVPTSVSINNSNAQPVPVSDAGGTLSVDDGGSSLTVDGTFLTDAQLRATPVPVAGPLTDTQLRATPVPVVASAAVRTPTTTSVAGTASSTLILAQDANRKGLTVSNVSTSKLYLSFSTPATVANSFMEMQPGSFVLFDQQLIVANAIYGIWTNANGTAQVTQYV